MGVKIEDLPLRLQAQARAQLDSYARASQPATIPSLPESTPSSPKSTRASKGPNKTEADYQRYHLRGMDARFEAVTFRMANGHRYTPDWVVFVDGRPVACHECKGGYALHSQQRARLAFDQVRVEFPGLVWVWAIKTPAGWQVDIL